MLSLPKVLLAGRSLVVERGSSSSGYNDTGYLLQEIEFNEMEIDMKEELQEFFGNQRAPEEMSTRELRKQIEILKQPGAQVDEFETAYF